MANEKPDPPIDPAQQVRQHLDSLRAAGVEWAPVAPPFAPTPAPAAPPAERRQLESPGSVVQTGLFGTVPVAVPSENGDEENRRRELTVLAEQVSGCQRCSELWSTRSRTVFGVGPLEPELCFVGEAPGYEEDKQGIPFVGPAGQLLTRIITACGLKRDEVYILNILKCRPPGNRTPRPEEAHNCQEYLERQIELIQPRFLCALGATAATYLLGTTTSISRLRGKFLEYRGIPVMCTFHPSYLLRTPEKKKEVWEDMKTLLVRMGRTVPGKSG
jgi:DNA polymerase